jgi:hypothetical protein
MICPSCRLFVTAPDATVCPQCGQPLTARRDPRAAGYGSPFGAMPGAPEEAPPPNVGAQRSRPFSSGRFSDASYDDPAFDGGAAYGPTARQGFAPPGQYPPGYNPSGSPPGQMAPPAWAGPPGAPPVLLPPRPMSKKRRVSKVLLGIAGVLGLCLISLGVRVALYLGATALTQTAPKTSAAATITPFPSTLPGETVIFQDALASDTNQWVVDPAHCFYQDGAYHLKDAYICYADTGSIDDANIKVDARQVAGPTVYFYGIVLRRTSQGNYYEFTIDSNSKWSFGKVVNEKYTDLVTQSSLTIKGGLNTTNTLLVRARGSHFAFYVNGAQVGEMDDTTFSSGRVGLVAGTHIEVAYNNFQITRSGG